MKKNFQKSLVGVAMILVAALVTSIGQFLWKQSAICDGKLKYILMISGFLLFAANGFLVVISYRFGELSILQPILSTGFVFSLLLGKIFLHEQHSIFKYLGISSILLGVFVLARCSQVGGKEDCRRGGLCAEQNNSKNSESISDAKGEVEK